MKFSVKINILPQDALLDPQGKTVENNTTKLGIENISNIRIGKHITLDVEGEDINTVKKNNTRSLWQIISEPNHRAIWLHYIRLIKI